MIQTVYTGKNHSISDINLVEDPVDKRLIFGKIARRWIIMPGACGMNESWSLRTSWLFANLSTLIDKRRYSNKNQVGATNKSVKI